jgi:hypothetical protein
MAGKTSTLCDTISRFSTFCVACGGSAQRVRAVCGRFAGGVVLRATSVSNYTALLDCIRARKAELDISFEVLDAVSGLQSGYSAKLLAPHPARRLGEVSLACLLGALGLRLIVEPDPVALALVRDRLVQRQVSVAGEMAVGAAGEAAGECKHAA